MIYFIAFAAVIFVLNPWGAKRLEILAASQRLAVLKRLPSSQYDFPRSQSVFALSLIGLLVGLAPALRTAPAQLAAVPLWFAVVVSLVATWAMVWVIVAALRWWMRRGERWDGRGSMFNILAASWLVIDIVGAGLTAMGVAPLFILPLWLYSLWVGANALSGAAPKASSAYCLGGIFIALRLAIVVSGFVFALMAIAAHSLGLLPANMAPR